MIRTRRAPTPVKEGRRGVPVAFAPLLDAARLGEAAAVAAHPVRHRSEAHRRFVAAQPCCVCNPAPAKEPLTGEALSQCAHLAFAQPRARGLKSGDQFSVPLCPHHHADFDGSGAKPWWFGQRGLKPLLIAERLWQASLAADRVRSDDP